MKLLPIIVFFIFFWGSKCLGPFWKPRKFYQRIKWFWKAVKLVGHKEQKRNHQEKEMPSSTFNFLRTPKTTGFWEINRNRDTKFKKRNGNKNWTEFLELLFFFAFFLFLHFSVFQFFFLSLFPFLSFNSFCTTSEDREEREKKEREEREKQIEKEEQVHQIQRTNNFNSSFSLKKRRWLPI